MDRRFASESTWYADLRDFIAGIAYQSSPSTNIQPTVFKATISTERCPDTYPFVLFDGDLDRYDALITHFVNVERDRSSDDFARSDVRITVRGSMYCSSVLTTMKRFYVLKTAISKVAKAAQWLETCSDFGDLVVPPLFESTKSVRCDRPIDQLMHMSLRSNRSELTAFSRREKLGDMCMNKTLELLCQQAPGSWFVPVHSTQLPNYGPDPLSSCDAFAMVSSSVCRSETQSLPETQSLTVTGLVTRIVMAVTVDYVHWVGVGIDASTHHAVVYDPLGHSGDSERVKKFVKDSIVPLLPQPPSPRRYTVTTLQALPVQQDTSSCGVYVLAFAEMWTKDALGASWDPATANGIEYLRYRYMCMNLDAL